MVGKHQFRLPTIEVLVGAELDIDIIRPGKTRLLQHRQPIGLVAFEPASLPLRTHRRQDRERLVREQPRDVGILGMVESQFAQVGTGAAGLRHGFPGGFRAGNRYGYADHFSVWIIDIGFQISAPRGVDIRNRKSGIGNLL